MTYGTNIPTEPQTNVATPADNIQTKTAIHFPRELIAFGNLQEYTVEPRYLELAYFELPLISK